MNTASIDIETLHRQLYIIIAIVELLPKAALFASGADLVTSALMMTFVYFVIVALTFNATR